MKKNITINLCGRLFQIDEDAYELLQQYISSLRSSFGRQDGGDEIVDDIEARIAELFDELKSNGTVAITIEHVRDIIMRIGKPEQLAGDDEKQNTGENGNWKDAARSAAQSIRDNVRARTAGKKLYRNPKDKMVAGVMSGLAAYTGTDVTWWRLGIFVFTLFTGVGLLAYIILAIVLPQADLPEEQLQMQGIEVTPQNLADAVVDHHEPVRVQRSALREVFSIIMKIVIGFFVVIAIIVAVSLGLALLGVLLAAILSLLLPTSSIITLPFSLGNIGLIDEWHEHSLLVIGFVISLLTVMFIPVYAFTHMLLSLTQKIKPMGTVQRIVCVVLWIIALGCAIPLGNAIRIIYG